MAYDNEERLPSSGLVLLYRLGGLVGRGLLLLTFYLLFMPVGMLVRWLGGDPLHRTLDASSGSYYQPSKVRAGKHMDKQY